ncbi:class I SAM-dependent DNA methyltransferase [Vallitalea okinawensis]|uniref:class I SAM-dependent DNA methyltransferase n=1 Tax=Vallitalea okinawensis TaxID=2078660 RepID=UPI000CFD431E|nr:class I SAM-dependent methyltransferase [Vallitalea okinawensis]
MKIINEKEHFNKNHQSWLRQPDDHEKKIIKDMLNKLNIDENSKVLDICCGSGILYPYLRFKSIKKYIGLDISEKLLQSFKLCFHEVETICEDFDQPFKLDQCFNRILIYNSIPHFENLETVFSNVRTLLADGGTFAIAHARSRQGLKEHHQRIGYSLGRDAIPTDLTLKQLCHQNGFKNIRIEDENYFYFSVGK